MKLIQITKNLFTQVDDEDYDWLNQWKWYAKKGRNTYYVQRDTFVLGKKQKIMMHRQILGLLTVDFIVDHKDYNGLNNQKNNLRKATYSQNGANKKKKLNCSSQYKGVIKRTSKYTGIVTWEAKCIKDYKQYTKNYKTELEAALAYDNMATEFFGEFANLNFK